MKPYFFDQFLEAFKEAVCITDSSGVVLSLNKKYYELTEYTQDIMIGKNVLDLVHNGRFDIVLNPIIVQQKRSVTRIQNLPSGKKLILEGHPILDPEGEVAYVVTFIYDVTVLSELKEQVETQKELLDTFKELQSGQSRDITRCPSIIHSRAMRNIFGQMSAIAATDATVLLLGETGVGKDVFAQRLHAVSTRSSSPFIKADCGSIPAQLIETELFGYAPGTFSGGSKSGKAGLIEAASSGTLFLDEIGELPLLLQSRLLRILQDGEITRVGSTTPIRPNVRVIAATNKDLEGEVIAGRFRSDLYYRLKVAVIQIPPLRERKADILPLAHCFLEFYCAKYKKKVSFSPSAERVMEEYLWPGNVRELENLIHSLVITHNGRVCDADDLPITRTRCTEQDWPAAFTPDLRIKGKSFREIRRQIENNILLAGLQTYGSLTEAAKQLKLDRATIFRKVRELEKDLGRKLPLVRGRYEPARKK